MNKIIYCKCKKNIWWFIVDTTNQLGNYSRYIRELSPRQRKAKRIKQDVQKRCQAFASGKSGDNAGTFKDLQGM